ncbi:cytochrome c biogenesis protein CcdA [Lacicoccus alkaliphilus]|uniref:Cytochrome c-type biogenesis protein n=1 Tax=Lacicoccus alkaliphilus DSM 16010 TaxID=1123231 RepID=A0A1M7BY21_9BACL|nr:cytochrome c biogenesis protein CcdA [Salinicoccus alkaliphilus]SHL59837.1 cytochrome c-type biogenesis protein [Salinicoccus alkaliphilus DSM 16010]
MGSEVTFLLAFGAGVLSFVSPCVLPVFPAFVSYITGMSYNEVEKQKFNARAIFHTLFFLIGFSLIYIALGFGTSFFGGVFIEHGNLIRQIGAILIIVFGLIITGVLRFDFLMKDRKVNFKNRPAGFFGSILIGMAFAAGWTPCNGPIIGAIFAMSATEPNNALMLMVVYCLGFGVPFFILSFFVSKTRWMLKYSNAIMKGGGIVMILMGILLYFDGLTQIIIWLQPFFGDFQGF